MALRRVTETHNQELFSNTNKCVWYLSPLHLIFFFISFILLKHLGFVCFPFHTEKISCFLCMFVCVCVLSDCILLTLQRLNE